ncbi:MAG: S-methyl-5'-thioadenosine phosphorylase [Rhodobacteraceae bacterium]|nr:S-methyl-5'-thioadenosine phosphorylase [Paracoccaceae bacterium]
MRKTKIAIIGGSGIYDIDGLVGATWTDVETPWGAPSDQVLTGTLNGVDMVFLPRHGRGHVYSPTTVPYRANIDALKRLGVTDVISVSACGSFAASDAGITVHNGGTYLAMEGPQFSSIAESKMYRESWGADVIGMTNMPEAKLAREAELCYASVAMITDYDSWHPEHGSVDITSIIATLQGNAGKARDLVGRLPALLGQDRDDCPHGCDKALEFAIMTAPDKRDPELIAKLDAIAGRVL